MKFLKVVSYITIFFVLCSSFAFGILINVLNNQLIDFSILEFNSSKASILLDDEGKEWGRFELDKRGYTKYDKFPKHLIDAFLAAEDRDFFRHSGLSFKGIIRSSFINLIHGKIVQGASTITQQLVKLLFFDAKRTFKRKVKEQLLAILVESQFSKEQILELYLNNIYFGCGIYGVEAASQRFFGKSINNIDIAESAVLAAIVKSPINYCPLLSFQASRKRRDLILSLMNNLNYITSQEYEKSKNSELKLIQNKVQSFAPYLKETIRIFLEEKLGKQRLYCGGLKIQTTINLNIQQIAEEEFKKQFNRIKKELKREVDGALISIDVKTGEIKALIGGTDFSVSKWNRALQAKRQMGSIFKPIVYAAALENGATFADVEIDEPIDIFFGGTKWSPLNNTKNYDGKMTLAKALSYSKNTISVKTLMRTGINQTVNLAKKFKFSGQINAYPSLALGCLDVTLKEAIAAFNVFANNGVYVEPHFIKWIKDDMGIKIYKHDFCKDQILSSNIADQVAKVLTIGAKRYFDRLACKVFKSEALGKTGTTNQSRTCWFCGSTPELTTAIYVGCDDNTSMGDDIYPVRTVFPIWLEMYKKLNFKKTVFTYDTSLKDSTIDWVTGEKTDPTNPNAVTILINK